MTSSEPDVPIFTATLTNALGDRAGESPTFPAMLVENPEIEHPSAPEGARRMVESATFVAHLRDTPMRFTMERAKTRCLSRSAERRCDRGVRPRRALA
jgi:hypothetical protein